MAITDQIPKSRLTLTYRTTVRGEPEDRDLALPSPHHGGPVGRHVGRPQERFLDKRELRKLDGKNLDQAMADMDISVKVQVPNRIHPDKSEDLEAVIPIPRHEVVLRRRGRQELYQGAVRFFS